MDPLEGSLPVKILLVGFDTPGSLERFCMPLLRAMGHDVDVYDIHEHFVRRCHFYQTPILNELEHIPVRYAFNWGLARFARQVGPELVFVFKGAEVYERTLRGFLTLSPRPVLINWNPDNPFDIGTYNSNPHLVRSIPHYDLYFIWDKDLFAPLREAGAKRVEFLPFGYDPSIHHPVALTEAERESLGSQVCFVGTYTPQRAGLLRAFQDVRLGIWGSAWEKLPPRDPLRSCLRGAYTHGEDMAKIFSAAGIVLNFIRPQNGQSHNMRSFEAPACGGFMLATRTRQQMEWLPEGQAAAYFSTPEEMRAQTSAYLHSPAEREALAQEGLKRVTEGRHTYADRVAQIMETVGQL